MDLHAMEIDEIVVLVDEVSEVVKVWSKYKVNPTVRNHNYVG